MKNGFIGTVACVQKAQHHSGSLVSSVCLIPLITIWVSIPILFKKTKQNILSFCPPWATMSLCKVLAMLDWSSLSHACLPYCSVSSRAGLCLCFTCSQCLELYQCGKSTNQWNEWGNEHEEIVICSWKLSIFCVVLFTVVDIKVQSHFSCWATIK